MAAFQWGSNGERMSPEQIAKRRKVAEAMMTTGMDFSPVGHWSQGLARVAQAGIGAWKDRQLDRAEAASTEADAALRRGALESMEGGTGYPDFPSAGGPASGSPAGGAMAASGRYVSGNSSRQIAGTPADEGIYDQFIGTVKAGIPDKGIPGLTNPYGLSAVAATGQAESGFSPKNVYGEWSDPSESGRAGQAGGALSWRSDRLANMRRFAQANGDDPARPSPATQAKFFLNEDPSLITKLQGAGSAEEAQTLMNNAWRFAGYDRPGGEAGRRIATANAFLPRFADAGGAGTAIDSQMGGTDVASLDPSFMPGAPETAQVAPDFLTAGLPPVARPVEMPEGELPEGDAAMPPLAPPRDIGGVQRVAAAMLGGPQQSATAPDPKVQAVADAMSPIDRAMQADPTFDGFAQNTGWSQSANGQGSISPGVVAALSDPYASEETRSLAGMMLQRELAANKPMSQADQLGLQKTQLEIDALRNPQAKPTDDMREYEFARSQGYSGSFQDFRFDKSGGVPKIEERYNKTTGQPEKVIFNPQTRQFEPFGGSKAPSSGGVVTVMPDGTVQVGGGVKVPSGFQPDPNNPGAVMPIPGGPGEQIAGELAARIGLADEFMSKAPALRERLANGEASGPLDVFAARNNQASAPAQVHRELEFGVEALVRLLTGAGMNMSEAEERARRYLPTYTDDAQSMTSKLDSLVEYLGSAKEMSMRGRGGPPSNAASPGGAAPAADLKTKYGLE